MQIGILGAGNVGLAVGRRLTGAGHHVMLSSKRGPNALTPVAQSIGAQAASVTEAAAQELVLLAVPWLAVPEMVREASKALGDKGVHALSEEAEAAEPELIERTTPGLRAFAALAEANRPSG